MPAAACRGVLSRHDGIVFIRAADANAEVAVRKLHPHADCLRLLDDYLLISLGGGPSEWTELVLGFFSAIAPEYAHIIDPAQNVDNARRLLRALDNLLHLRPQEQVIDFGCGPGISTRVLLDSGFSAIAVDPSAAMREAALTAGLPAVLDVTDLRCRGQGSCRAALASYVLHLLADTSSLEAVWRVLAPGGVLVANHHKGRNVDLVTQFVREAGGSADRTNDNEAERVHGVYMAYRKTGQAI